MHISGTVTETTTGMPAPGLSVEVAGSITYTIVIPVGDDPDRRGPRRPRIETKTRSLIQTTVVTGASGSYSASADDPTSDDLTGGLGFLRGDPEYKTTVTLKNNSGQVLGVQNASGTTSTFSFEFKVPRVEHPGTSDPVPQDPPVQPVAIDADSAIGRKWAELESAGRSVGRPLAPPVDLPEGAGQTQSFEHGTIVATAVYGAVCLSPALFNKWTTLGMGAAAAGLPTDDSVGNVSGAEAVYLEHGMLVRRPEGQSYVVLGSIYALYRREGDISGGLGLPLSDDLMAVNGGRLSRFDNAEIYWRADTGAHIVRGEILARWTALGGPTGLGYPISDEEPLTGPGPIQASRFERGLIVWSADTGAHELTGEILMAWEGSLQAMDTVGLPIGPETRTRSGRRYNSFQRGVIVAPGMTPTEPFVATGAELYFDSFVAHGSDGVGGIAGDQDLYVKVNIRASTGEHVQKQMPSSGTYGNSHTVNSDEQPGLRWAVLRGDLVVNVVLEGWESDDWPGHDDLLGTISAILSADNLWGMASIQHKQGDFAATFSMRFPGTVSSSVPFRKQLFWRFVNFGTPTLTWNQYAQTFNDVREDEPLIDLSGVHLFDHLFYSLVYAGLANGGNCFGICLASIFAQIRRGPYAEPINRWGPDLGKPNELIPMDQPTRDLMNVMNIKHGYQIGSSAVSYAVEKFISGGTHDPVGVFSEVERQLATGDWPVLVLTSGYFNLGGHVVRPYRCDRASALWKIYVANPNRPASASGGSADGDDGNVVIIDPKENTFTFVHGSSTWTGSSWTGGRMYSFPFHIFSSQPTTPFWEILTLVASGAFLILGAGSATRQFTDSTGRTLFEPGVSPRLWSDLRKDPVQRIPNLAPILALGADPQRHLPEFYALRGKTDRLTHEHTTPTGTGAVWAVFSAGLRSSVQMAGASGVTDAVALERLGEFDAAVAVTAGMGATTTRKARVALAGWGGASRPPRRFDLRGVDMSPGAGLHLGVTDGGHALMVQNRGPATQFELHVHGAAGDKSTAVRPAVSVSGGKTLRIQPQTWSADAIAGTPIVVDELESPGARKGKRTVL